MRKNALLCVVVFLCSLLSQAQNTLGLNFDGVDDLTIIPQSNVYNRGVSSWRIEAWIKVDPIQAFAEPTVFSNREAVNGNTGIQIFLSGGKVTARIAGLTTSSAGADLRDGLCHHIAIGRSSGGTVSLYIDGVFVNNLGSYPNNVNTSHPIWIGNDEPNTTTSPFKGLIHEMRFWTSGVSNQIAANKNIYLAGNENSLIGYWRMNDGSGQIINDLSPTNNDGTLGSSSVIDASDPVYAPGCMCSNTATITSSGGNVICSAAGITLSANTGAGLFYQWKRGGVGITGATSSTHTTTIAGVYTCMIYSTSCGNTSNIITLTSSAPTVNIFYNGSSYICNGSSAGFTCLYNSAGTNPSFQWQLNGVDIAGATDSVLNTTQAGTYNLIVTNNQNGCSGNAASLLPITVFTGPPNVTAQGTITSSDCSGKNLEIVGGSVLGYSYQWRKNSINISGATNSTYFAITSGIFSCNVTNACGSTITNNVSVVNTAIGTGYIDTISGNTSFCSGSVTLSAPYFNGAIYQWYNNNNLIENSSSSIYFATGSGNYSCRITTLLCGSNFTLNSINVEAGASIVAGGSTTFCSGESVNFYAFGGSTAQTFQWQLNGSDITGETSSFYTATTSGSYGCVINSTQCGTTTSNSISVISGSPPPLTLLMPGGNFGTPVDVCNIYPSMFCQPENAGYYVLYDYSNPGFGLLGSNDGVFVNPGTGYYYVDLTTSCGTITSNVISIRDINSHHAVFSDGVTTYCSSETPPNLYVSYVSPWGSWPPQFPYSSPPWDSYQWTVNGTPITSGGANFPYHVQPMITGWYSCSVSNSCGSAATVDSIYITVNTTPPAIVTASGPLTFCQGQSVIFNVSTTPSATYRWYRNGVQVSIDSVYTANLDGTYKVNVTNGTCTTTSTDQVVTLTNAINPTLNCYNPTILCNGQTATLEANVGAGYSYVWSLNGSVIVGALSSTYNANISGNYSVKITDLQSCYNVSPTLALVGGLAASNITTNAANPLCSGSNISLFTNLTGNSVSAVQWKLNGVAIAGATTATYSHITTAASAGLYTVDITNPCGVFTSTPYSLAINATPTAPVVTSSGNNFFCTSGSVVLNTTPQNGMSYQWYNPSAISGATNANYTATAAGTYIVRATSTDGCIAASTGFNVYASGFAPSITPTVFTACTPFTFTATPSSGVTYQWKSGSSNISGATADTYIPSASGTYSCVMTGACGTATSNAQNITLYGTPIAQAGVIIYPDTNVACTGQNVFIGVNRFVLPPYVSQTTRQWKLNGVAIPGATGTSYYATVTGTYSLDITNACGTTTSNAETITFNAQPTSTISASGSTDLCNGGSVTLNANTGAGLTYQWKVNGVGISGANSSAYTTSVGGTYQCIVTNNNSCGITSNFINVFTGSGTAPTATLTPSGTLFICSGTSQLLTAGSGNGYSYQWKINGNPISGATNSTYTASIAGNYEVEVSNPCGSATSAVTILNISPTPAAAITPAGPTSVCSGNVILNANIGTGLSYQWQNNGVAISGATTATFAASISGNYTVVVTSSSGCSNTSSSVTVTIGALTAGVTPSGSVSFCVGNTLTLSATLGATFTYQWYRNNTVISGATLSTLSVTDDGSYKCTVTATSCSVTTNTVVATRIVNPTPVITTTTPTSFCAPGSVTLTSNTYAGVVYQWENNGVSLLGATSQSYNATSPGQYRVLQTANGCSRYSSKLYVTSATSVNASITATGPTTLCSGGTVPLSVTSAIPGYTYQWKKDGVALSGANGFSYTASLTGNYECQVTASCGNVNSNTISVSIGTFAAQISPSGSVSICAGNAVTLVANTGTGFTYQWKNNGTDIPGATGATYLVNAVGNYSVTINSSCGSGTSTTTAVTFSTVSAAITPSAPVTLCTGSSVTYTANSGSGYTYRWFKNNVFNGITASTFTTANNGSYKVEVSLNGACPLFSNTAVFTVINNPTPTLTANGPLAFCAGQNVMLTNNTFAGVTYQWQKNSSNITGATSQSYTANATGSYRCQQTANGCSKFSPKVSVVVNCRLGNGTVEDIDDDALLGLQVSPNPFKDKLNIAITSPTDEQVVVKLFDVLGKLQHSQTVFTNATTEINALLPAGVYILFTTINGNIKTVKVVKTK